MIEEDVVCPMCGEQVQYEPPYPADPETNVQAWPGGYWCSCGWMREDDPHDDEGH